MMLAVVSNYLSTNTQGETMQTIRFILSATVMIASGLAYGGGTDAAKAVNHSVQASAHGSASAAHAVAASGKTTSAVVAVPLSVGGVALSAAGAVSTSAAAQLSNTANSQPLPITDEVITTVPPDQALRSTATPQ